MAKRENAFTLIELSIILIIISLIVGGIIGGKALIRSSQIRSITQDIAQIRTAINNYKLQYDALPGDHSTALDYFGIANCPTIASSQCNGDGNHKLDDISAGKYDKEGLRAWQHLTLSQLYPGNYTGVYDLGTTGLSGATLGLNIPSSSITQTGYWLRGFETIFSRPSNFLRIGKSQATGGRWPWSGFLLPAEAKQLDRKLDNGSAISGSILAFDGVNNAVNSCTGNTYSVNTPSEFILSSTLHGCAIVVDIGF